MLDGMFGEHACSWPRGEIMKRIWEYARKKAILQLKSINQNHIISLCGRSDQIKYILLQIQNNNANIIRHNNIFCDYSILNLKSLWENLSIFFF
jgi:hypothetical protein